MKSLFLSLSLLLFIAGPIYAQTPSPSPSPSATVSGEVKGLYDDVLADSSDSATLSATPTPTPQPRTTTMDVSNTPVSGAVENTIVLLIGGFTLMFIGLRFSKS